MRSFLPGIGACLALLVTTAAPAAPPDLPAFGADPSQTSVSGLSSGAYMAVQLQVAYSRSIVGAGVVAGGPYFCADGGGLVFTGICMGKLGFAPDATTMADLARAFAAAGKIDPLANLRKRRVYLFAGTEDSVVKRPAVDAAAAFFRQAGVKAANLKYVNDVPAGHALIISGPGNACELNKPPYINHCDMDGKGYDQAGAILRHIYGTLRPRVEDPAGEVLAFNQRAFAVAATLTMATSMADTAYLYVPPGCRAAGARCRVHIALHGCLQSVESVGAQFHSGTGYNNWAENNKLLVLYPQVDKAALLGNPEGCWDWWGYTGPGYTLKSASQMRAIMAMVRQLTRPR